MNRPRLLVGISGGIAAYKAAEVVRGLVRDGADVRVAMTRGAREFVAPLTFAVLSRHEVHTEVFEPGAGPQGPAGTAEAGPQGPAGTAEAAPHGPAGTAGVAHVALAEECDLLLVAPATAHTLAKLAHGLADDFLSTYALAHRGRLLLAPAMETAMWAHPAVRANVEILTARGAHWIGPDEGELASGHQGVGRMAAPEAIVAAAMRLASGSGRDLAGLRLLVTAGPTREPIDPIRFVSNRSSGRMGFALAEAARDRGASVTLLAGPTAAPRPAGVRVVPFETADELHAALVREFPECDGLAMAAAVADFIPEESRVRLHRSEGERALRLKPGRDILASVRPLRRGQTVVAFAAETEDLETRALAKRESKGADIVVVNDVGRSDVGFDAAENEVVILGPGDRREAVSRRTKREVADRIWDAFVLARSHQPIRS
ncbi:MAG TPA: bifunctional phosphopantothenoylcysteine decarboxylase/phosphopantothenate--cysteine ligase CoaBC [Thermoanaerobaculia bacterium]|nr:bifunctional phosphopantothenoylcysteine decarboxylase/phosphopantothenate--cysteine ligase CoaBC [Thermoanaerobaculia bacterium]